MADERIVKLAEILVDHSLEVKAGEKVLIIGSMGSELLIRECYRLIMRRGAIPFTHVFLPELKKVFYDEANESQLQNTEFDELLYQNCDALIQIDAKENLTELTNVDSQKLTVHQKARLPIMEYMMQGKVRWVLTRFPTQAFAQQALMSLEEYEEFVYSATNVDYHALHESMIHISEAFDQASKVRIVGKETDLTIDIEGRKAVICSGKQNIPDGEFFYTPNHLKTEGHIYYQWPTVYGGRKVQGIRLTFKEGKIVEYSAESGQEQLEQALNTDDGAKFLGELGIGMNTGIDMPTSDILFDEKIGGSVHLAVGRAYEEGGEGNKSAIHWDMVKNLKDGGEIYLDGKLVQKDGEWLL
ncbi:aminopeptidase [Longirhabdus pacifica]|uniref:aminopeptidase n=1 Tax=Longirhabdus pacifica TaxID=2305227 RepID=UPI001008F4C2|nr:aminopeptidase [Longirhabdus pacifica]